MSDAVTLAQARNIALVGFAQEILKDVKFPDYEWLVAISHGGVTLRARYYEKDVTKPEGYQLEEQLTRRWILSPKMGKSEIVFTAYKCVATSFEHRAREHFTYRGRRIASPHFDVDDLWELCETRSDAGARAPSETINPDYSETTTREEL